MCLEGVLLQLSRYFVIFKKYLQYNGELSQCHVFTPLNINTKMLIDKCGYRPTVISYFWGLLFSDRHTSALLNIFITALLLRHFLNLHATLLFDQVILQKLA